MTDEQKNKIPPINVSTEKAVKARIGILGLPVNKRFYDAYLQKLKNKGLTLKEATILLDNATYHFIAYNKFLQAQGLEGIHIDYHLEEGEIEEIMDSLDGIFLTGGGDYWSNYEIKIDGLEYFKVDTANNPKPYLSIIRRIMDKAKSINEKGRHFPVYSVCLGFEAILLIETECDYPIAHVKNHDVNLKIKFKEQASRLKAVLSEKQRKDIETEDLLYFNHGMGFTEKHFDKYKALSDNYAITSTMELDGFGSCVASFEHKRYPFFGTQYHVEKNMFDFSVYTNPHHSEEVYQVGLALGRLCVPKSVLKQQKGVQIDRFLVICTIKEKKTTIVMASKDPRIKLLDDG